LRGKKMGKYEEKLKLVKKHFGEVFQLGKDKWKLMPDMCSYFFENQRTKQILYCGICYDEVEGIPIELFDRRLPFNTHTDSDIILKIPKSFDEFLEIIKTWIKENVK